MDTPIRAKDLGASRSSSQVFKSSDSKRLVSGWTFFFWSIQSRPPFVKMNSSFVIKIQSSDSQISQCTIIHEMTEYPEDHPHFSTFFPIFLAIPWGNSSMFPIGGPAHRWQPGRGFLWCSSSRPPGAGWRFVRRWNVKTAGNWTLSGHF